jgi:hypothetical protein
MNSLRFEVRVDNDAYLPVRRSPGISDSPSLHGHYLNMGRAARSSYCCDLLDSPLLFAISRGCGHPHCHMGHVPPKPQGTYIPRMLPVEVAARKGSLKMQGPCEFRTEPLEARRRGKALHQPEQGEGLIPRITKVEEVLGLFGRSRAPQDVTISSNSSMLNRPVR